MDVIKEKILNIVDSAHDGVLTLKSFRKNNMSFTEFDELEDIRERLENQKKELFSYDWER